ncbi:MAG: hypothetical protein LC623_02880 [Halobacteriales archaeon]|nr:hypothetical protein [Halobacteriales archaeon]
MRALLLAALLASASLLSGCASRPAAEPTDEAPAGSGESAAGPDGTSTASTTGAASHSPAEAPAKPAAPKTTAVAESGNLPPCAGSPSNGPMPCNVVFGDERWFRQDIEGTVLSADLTLTWTAADPTMANLKLSFTPIKEVSGGGEQFTGDTRSIDGPSPLHLALDGLGWTEGTYTIAVWWSGDVAAAPQQDFKVEGSIVSA